MNWHTRVQPKDVPLCQTCVIDLENSCANPAPLQPAVTQNKCTNFLYFISNEKFFCLMRSEGRGFALCDRMYPEILYEVTQTGNDLGDVQVKIEVNGRWFIKKSIGLMKPVIMKVAKP